MGLLDKLITGSYKNQPRRKLFPQTRGEVFGEMFRYRKRTLINVSLICALFALPAMVCTWLGLFYKGSLPELIAEGSVAMPVEEDEALSLLILGMQIDNVLCLIGFVTNALLFLGLSGAMRVIQLLVWGEHVSFFYDFRKGLCANWKFYIACSALFSLSMLFAVFFTGYYIIADTFAVVKGICIAIAILQFVIVCGIVVFALPHANLYRLSFFGTLRNAFILFVAALPKNIGFLLLSVLPLLLFAVPSMAVQTLAAIAAVLLYPSYVLLIWALRSNAEFDKYLNVGENARAAGKGINWEEESEQALAENAGEKEISRENNNREK